MLASMVRQQVTVEVSSGGQKHSLVARKTKRGFRACGLTIPFTGTSQSVLRTCACPYLPAESPGD